jgi:hypothetical protein
MAGHSLWLVEISFFPAQSKNAPSGNVLVASANTDNILRYNLADRSYLDIFATTDPECAVDMTLHNDRSFRFNSTTGDRNDTWSAFHIGLDGPSGFVFDLPEISTCRGGIATTWSNSPPMDPFYVRSEMFPPPLAWSSAKNRGFPEPQRYRLPFGILCRRKPPCHPKLHHNESGTFNHSSAIFLDSISLMALWRLRRIR